MAKSDLKPVRTKEEAKERGRNGGIKSGEARRRKRDAKAAAKLILDMGTSKTFQPLLKDMGVDKEDYTNRVALMARAFAKGMAGDVHAMQFLIDMAGESPKHKMAEDQFEYRKERDAGISFETEDLEEVEEAVYGESDKGKGSPKKKDH